MVSLPLNHRIVLHRILRGFRHRSQRAYPQKYLLANPRLNRQQCRPRSLRLSRQLNPAVDRLVSRHTDQRVGLQIDHLVILLATLRVYLVGNRLGDRRVAPPVNPVVGHLVIRLESRVHVLRFCRLGNLVVSRLAVPVVNPAVSHLLTLRRSLRLSHQLNPAASRLVSRQTDQLEDQLDLLVYLLVSRVGNLVEIRRRNLPVNHLFNLLVLRNIRLVSQRNHRQANQLLNLVVNQPCCLLTYRLISPVIFLQDVQHHSRL